MGFTIKFHSVHPEQRTAKPAMAPYPYPIQCRTVTAAGLQRVWRQAAGRGPPRTCCKRRKDAGPRESPMHGTAAALPVLFLLERSPCRDPARDTSRPASRRVEPWTHLSRPGINCMSAAARQPEPSGQSSAHHCLRCVPVRRARRDDGRGATVRTPACRNSCSAPARASYGVAGCGCDCEQDATVTVLRRGGPCTVAQRRQAGAIIVLVRSSFMEEQGVPGPAVDPVVAEPEPQRAVWPDRGPHVLGPRPWGCATAVLR